MTQTPEPRLRESQSILIVEDSIDDFESTKRAFRKSNLRNVIARAATGEEALAYLTSNESAKPGIILLDLNMPGLGGLKTLEIIKNTPELKKIPVVVLTTSSDERDIHRCYDMGANTYIQKPVDFDGLMSAMRQLKEYWFEIAVLPKDGERD